MSGAARPFRFALSAHRTPDAASWRDLARRAEDLGYATLLVSDHTNDQFAPLPALAAAAAVTTTLRVGTQVLANDFRNPVVAAKELATVDVLSEGRLDWGMGAGWLPPDYEATGVAFDAPAVRVARLAEAIGVMKALFAGAPVQHSGAFYRVEGAVGTPAPVQRPHPPLLLGAARPRLLALAAREADIVGLSPDLRSRQFGPIAATLDVEDALDAQVAVLREAAGGRFAALELSVTVLPARVTDAPLDVAARVSRAVGLDADDVLRSPHALIGSVGSLCETLEARRERWGISSWVVPASSAAELAPVLARLAGR